MMSFRRMQTGLCMPLLIALFPHVPGTVSRRDHASAAREYSPYISMLKGPDLIVVPPTGDVVNLFFFLSTLQ